MAEDAENVKVKVKDASGVEEFLTLGALSGINLDEVTEQRGFSFPKGDFIWEISTDPENLPRLAAIGEGDKAQPGIIVPCKCIDVIRVNDDEFTGVDTDLIGKNHRETMFLGGDLAVALGYFKAFVKDIGAPYHSQLKEQIPALSGVRFQAPISKRKDKNDTDKVYTSLNRMKLKPVEGAVVSEIAAKVA